MKHFKRGNASRKSVRLIADTAFFAALFLLSLNSDSAPIDLDMASTPLELGSQPPPNVLMIVDDSGSMDWEIVVAQDALNKLSSLETLMIDGEPFIYSNIFGFNGFGIGNDPFDNQFGYLMSYGRVAPTQKRVNSLSRFYSYQDEMAGIWRVRNPEYNLIYYNPERRYAPWPGFADANPSNAPVDPSKPTKTIDLTAVDNQITSSIPYRFGLGGDLEADETVYLPFYYTWEKSGASDTSIDAGECGLLIEIRPGARAKNCNGDTIGGELFPMIKSPKRTDCASLNSCTAAEELQNFANWFTYYRRREFSAKAALARVVETVENVNLGYTTINQGHYLLSAPNYPITDSTDPRAVMNEIYATRASNGGTFLLDALDGAGKYYACQSGAIIGGNCPATYSQNQACQQNYTVIMTDGFWEADNADWVGSGTGLSRTETVVTTKRAFADHDSDTSSPFAGPVFADNSRAGAASQQWLTLADIAMYYYMTDLDTSADNLVRPTAIERSRMVDPSYWDTNSFMHQHMSTFTVGFGVFNSPTLDTDGMDESGAWLPPAMNETVAWPRLTKSKNDANKLTDLKHAAFNGRGKYYSATDADGLTESLMDAFNVIKKGASSGGAAAVSFNSQTLSTDSVVYAAHYDTGTSTGDVIAYPIDRDSGQVNMNSPIWSAADQLASLISNDCMSPSDSRVLLSFNRDGANSGGVSFAAVPDVLNQQQVEWLRGYQNNEYSSGCTGASGLRDRTSKKILGDIINSRPLYIGPPQQNYRNRGSFAAGDNAYSNFVSDNADRQSLVVVGANDGFLHGFAADSGDEVFAYAPHRLIQGGAQTNALAALSDANYEHDYYVDLSPAVNDVFIKAKNDTGYSWNTVAIGGYRAGGRGYFALNLTNPSDFNSAARASDTVMWEFSDLDHSGMGLSFSEPLMSMTNQALSGTDNGHQWLAIFGNGYNSDDGVARLFLLEIDGGYDGWTLDSDFRVIDVGPTPASGVVKNGLSAVRGVDFDENGTLDYIYAGDYYGNLYRFDLTSASGAYTAQKIYQSGATAVQPIINQPTVVRHPSNSDALIVVFTTGSWMTTADAADETVQSIYGVVDYPQGSISSTPIERSELTARYLVNKSDNGMVHRVLQGDPIDWDSNSKGWYFDLNVALSPGERVVNKMVMRGGYMFAGTLIPQEPGSCTAGMGGAVMAFNPVTGLLDKAIFDFDNDGNFDSSNGEYIAGVEFENGVSQVAMISDHLVFQTKDGDGKVKVESVKTDTNEVLLKGRLSWRQLK